MTHTDDPNLSSAILHALREAGWIGKRPARFARVPTTYKPTLKGVYVNKGARLCSKFFRRLDGVQLAIHVATGRPGVFTEAEERRLHELWVAATQAWDAQHRRRAS